MPSYNTMQCVLSGAVYHFISWLVLVIIFHIIMKLNVVLVSSFVYSWSCEYITIYVAVRTWLSYWQPFLTLEWRHNERDGVSNHRHLGCLLNGLFRRRSKKTSKIRVIDPLCWEFTGDRWIPLTKGQLRGKCFHVMTSSWYMKIILV